MCAFVQISRCMRKNRSTPAAFASHFFRSRPIGKDQGRSTVLAINGVHARILGEFAEVLGPTVRSLGYTQTAAPDNWNLLKSLHIITSP